VSNAVAALWAASPSPRLDVDTLHLLKAAPAND
jgi:hypothetical protein